MLNDMKVPGGFGFNKDLQDALEAVVMLEIAEIVTKAAFLRRESRGSHYREDYPEISDDWKKSIVFNKSRRLRFIER
jgi:fumarate reductase (CoM/CoB) subunit A